MIEEILLSNLPEALLYTLFLFAVIGIKSKSKLIITVGISCVVITVDCLLFDHITVIKSLIGFISIPLIVWSISGKYSVRNALLTLFLSLSYFVCLVVFELFSTPIIFVVTGFSNEVFKDQSTYSTICFLLKIVEFYILILLKEGGIIDEIYAWYSKHSSN